MAASTVPSASPSSTRLLGASSAIAALRAQILHLAAFDAVGNALVPTVLLLGETGTGKSLVARVMHESGPRATGPFLDVNCAAIPDTMLEAELFGFEPGAFTDAKKAKPGLFEAASCGTLFLDEIDALPLALQGKLLTALETKRVRRLGAVTDRTVDVKLIAATNAALPQHVTEGRFRADLYHRLAVVVLQLPPLRERGEDAVDLAQTFLQHYATGLGVSPKRLTTEALAWVRHYAWPGNIRELGHVAERVTLLHMGEEVDAAALERLCTPLDMPPSPVPPPAPVVASPPARDMAPEVPPAPAAPSALPDEAEQLRQALVRAGGNVVQAARLLGISRGTMRYRMHRYSMSAMRPQELDPPGPAAQPPSAPPALPPVATAAAPAPVEPPVVVPVPAPSVPVPNAMEQKLVAVLTLELTWPDVPDDALPQYEPWTEAVRWERLIVEKVRGFGGMLLPRTASLLTCAFGLPRTLEQLPQRAVQAALALRHMVTTPDTPATAASRPAVRLAVHVGKVLVDAHTSDPAAHVLAIGDTLALPVRLLGEAEPGEIIVSPDVERFVAPWVSLEPRSVRRAGRREQITGYVITGSEADRPPVASRPRQTFGPFVGRERELALLAAALRQVERGQGQVVGLMGEAGVGKSRLLYEFRQRVEASRVTYVEGRCVSYGSTVPYVPVLDLLRALWQLRPDAGPEEVRAQVAQSLQSLGLDAAACLPYMLQLFGVSVGTEPLAALTPEAIQARTFTILHQLWLSQSQQRPLVLVIEDLHWLDSVSSAYLAALAAALTRAPMLLLVTYRPGYRPPWISQSHATQFTLGPLSTEESLSVIQGAYQLTPLAITVAQRILDKAEGNPFFLEELTKDVLEQRAQSTAVTVPTTIQGVLLARIDRLPDAPRRLLQTAAILGRAFTPQLLEAIWEGPEPCATLLDELQRLEFLYERRTPQEFAYVFKHALLHDVAYDSQALQRRQALHAAAGQALEQMHAAQLDTVHEQLAYHYARTTESAKAVTYLMQVARKASRSYALAEAVSALQEARRHVPQLAEANRAALGVDLALRQGRLLTFLGRLPETLALLLTVQTEVEQLQDPHQTGAFHALLSTTYSLMGDHSHATRHAHLALAPASACGDHATLGRTYYVLSMEDMWSGQWRQGVEHGAQAIAELGAARDEGWLGQAYWITGANHMFLGAFAEALAAEAQVQRLGEALSSPRLLSYAAWTTGLTHTLMGAWEEGILCGQRAVEQAPDPFCRTEAQGFLGYAYLEKGDAAVALSQLEPAVQHMRRFQFRQLEGWFTVWCGEAYTLAGEYDKARATLLQGLEIVSAVGFHVVVGWGQRALAQIALAEGAYAEASQHVHNALEILTSLQSRTEIARTCLLVLAPLALADGQPEVAASHLRLALTHFQALQMPVYCTRTQQLAVASGLTLEPQ